LIGGIDYENNGHGSGQANAEVAENVSTTLTTLHEAPIVTHSLRGEGFDASEDGTGRGTPLVPVAIRGTLCGRSADKGGPGGTGATDDGSMWTLSASETHAVAYSMITANTGANGLGVAAEVAPTLDRAQPCAIAFSHQAGGTQTTLGYDQERGTAPTLSKCQTPAVAFESRLARNGRGAPSEIVPPLKAQSGETGKGDAAPLVCMPNTLYDKGITQGDFDGRSQETYAGKILFRVRQEIGAQAFAQWGLGILDSLRTAKILRPEVHGEKFRQAPFSRSWVVCCALGSPFTRSEGAMRSLREAIGEGCPSQGWESLEQCADELGAYLSQLSQPGTQAERFMHDLWQADEGAGLLRQALSKIQAVGRSDDGEGKPAYGGMQVRRLTPLCCEFLQGFPRNYTLIPYRNKPAADGPRYKALGNSMAVPVMAWIGKRIQQVEEISCTTKQKYPSA